MGKKKKFKPVITRVKLNPEQAVLSCACYDTGWQDGELHAFATNSRCWTVGFFGSKGVEFNSSWWSSGFTSS